MIKDILEGTVYLFAIKGLTGIIIPPWVLIPLMVLKKTLEYFLGWFDQKVGFWKIENAYASEHLNPFNEELMKRIKNIENEVYKEYGD